MITVFKVFLCNHGSPGFNVGQQVVAEGEDESLEGRLLRLRRARLDQLVLAIA